MVVGAAFVGLFAFLMWVDQSIDQIDQINARLDEMNIMLQEMSNE